MRFEYLSVNSPAPELTARVKVRVGVNNNNLGASELTDKYRDLSKSCHVTFTKTHLCQDRRAYKTHWCPRKYTVHAVELNI